MSTKLVSVIIPAYNAAPLILETIESILRQTYKPIEVIVIDDGSEDNTAELLKPFSEAGRIRYIKQNNQGQAAARLNGFKVSKGDFVSFVDSDDLIAPEKIALQVEYMQKNPDCSVCYSDIAHFWHHQPEVLLHKNLNYYHGFIFDKLIKENFIQVMTALIRREVLEKYGLPGPEFRRSDDWYLWLNLAYYKVKFCFIDKVLSFQRRQKQGTLSDQKTYFKETAERNITIYQIFKNKLKPEEIKKYGIDELINFWQFRRVVGYVILGDKAGALNVLKQVSLSFKKAFLHVLILLIPVSVLGRFIFQIREFKRRRSFSPLADKTIKLSVYVTK